MEIGSIYSIDSFEKEDGLSVCLARKNAIFFSLCREALLVVAIKYRETNRKVLLPAYTCQTVLDPFQQEGWTIEYYNIKPNLRIDTFDLKDKYYNFKPSICVAHPFYGADLNQKELEVFSELKNKGCVLVEDLTQCIFSEQYNQVFDYFLGSYRKWFAIPDGAFLLGNTSFEENLAENENFVQSMSDAMYLRGVFHKTGDANVKEVSRRIGNIAISQISGNIIPHAMSAFSKTLLSRIDIEETKKKRLSNYLFLYENLQDSRYCTPVERSIDELTCAPLFFPVYVDDRMSFQKKLVDQEVFAPILWPVHTESLLINNSIKNIYDKILMLPIDQRYERSDMERMINVINK